MWKKLRAVINGQSALKEELLDEIGKVSGEVKVVSNDVREVIRELQKVSTNLTTRIDRLGL